MSGLFKKFMDFAFGNIIVLIIGFISTPIITRMITREEFGKFTQFQTVSSLFMIVLVLGLDQAYVRFFYEEKEENRGRFLSKCLKIPLLFNILVSIVILIFYKPLSIFIIDEVSLNIILLLILFNTINIFYKFSPLLVRMQQKGKVFSVIQIIYKVSYILLIFVYFFFKGDNYLTVALATVTSTLIATLAAMFFERKIWFDRTKARGSLQTSSTALMKFGVPLIFSTSIIWVFQSIDKFTISAISGKSELGLYGVAMQLVGLLTALQGTFSTFFVPIANEHYSKTPEDTKFFTNINSIICLVMFTIGVGLIACKDIIVLLLGPEYTQAIYIFPFLIFNPIMYTISETTVIGINFKQKTSYQIIVSIISALINISLNLLLVPHYGAKGAAISTGISYIVFFAVRTFISKRFYKVNYHLVKFFICTALLSTLALYASFNSFDLITFIMAAITLGFVFMFYFKSIKFVINTDILLKRFKKK